ncbi:hypothetical protein [Sphingopyxis sp. JAI128]|uniref:hypothetical protein n=1 Tax=Sphingopyxis sp. JAI128 TaxID=2723066 RepID=UPI001611216A|nr:hypothetical protein [Sphingopyxis sp. JAI128]MBB6424936.1 hypothetical protein [Sphingopyxis sp. JAI128]
MQGPWDDYRSDAPASQGGLTRITPPAAPDPYKERADIRAEEDQGMQRQKFGVETGNTAFNQRDKLRSDYNALPTVKEYRVAVQSLAAALKRGEDGSGDTALIYDYVKALDPTSVVREAEVGMAASGASTVEAAAAKLKKEFGIEGGGNLPPEVRKRLRREIITSVIPRVKQYNQFRNQYEELARRNNFDPYEIVGNHDADPYVELFRSYDKQNKIGEYGRKEPSTRVPGATMDNIRFDMDGGPEPVTGKRLSPEQEQEYSAFIESNRSNLTPELLNAWWQSRGFGGLENAAEVVEAAKKGNLEGIDYRQTDAERRAELDEKLRNQGGLTSTGMDYAKGGEAGLNRGLTLGWSDELAGLGGGLDSLIRGEGFSEGYANERDIERRAQEISRESAGVVPELVGGLLLPGGAASQARTAGQFAKQGATLGAIAGAGEGEGVGGTIKGGIIGSGVGATIGGAVSQAPRLATSALNTEIGQRASGAVSRGIDRLRRPQGNLNTEVVEAGERLGVPVRLPDALPEARNAMAVAEASPTAGPRIRTALDDDTALIQDRVRAQGRGGQPLENDDLGASIQEAGRRFIARSRAQANNLYSRAERAAGDVRILPVQASLAIRKNINELAEAGETTNNPTIQYLRDLNNDLSRDGGLSIQALRNLRTNMRGQLDQRGLTKTDADRRVMEVLDAASDDIAKALGNNPQAADAYRAADRFFREKQTFIKDVVQKFTGPRVDGQNFSMSAERAASTLKSMMQSQRGDMRRFQEMIGRLDQSERRDLAASVAEQLGTARNGEFSLAALSTNTSKMNPRALRLLFGDEAARAIQDLRVLARAKADTLGGLNNSKSGVVAAGTNTAKDVILGALGGGMGGVPGAMAGMATRGILERLASGRASRLLLNPDFTRWLRQMPDVANPAAIERNFDKLNKVASRDQAFLMDARAIQDYVRSAMSQSPTRAAASSQEEQDRR